MSVNLNLLLSKYDQILIPLPKAAKEIGLCGSTARNAVSNGSFPIATIKQGRLRFVHVHDLAAYLDALPIERDMDKRIGHKNFVQEALSTLDQAGEEGKQ